MSNTPHPIGVGRFNNGKPIYFRGHGYADLSEQRTKLRARPTGVDTFALRREGLDTAVRFVRDKTADVWALCFGYRMVPKVKQG